MKSIILLISLLFVSNIYAQTIVLDSAIAEEKVEVIPEKLTLQSETDMMQNLKQLPNTNVIGELSGHPFELVINGVSGFRHNYSIWGIPINFESTSGNDLSLLGAGRYRSIDIEYDNIYMLQAIGSNVNLTPKIEGDNIVLIKGKSNYNFSMLGSYLFPKKIEDFDMRVTIDYNRYKNKYDYYDDNGTLYALDDDEIITYDNGWSQNFHTTFTEKIKNFELMQDFNFVQRSVPMQSEMTNDPTEKVLSFMLLGNYGKAVTDNLLYKQNFLLNHNSKEVVDTNLAVTYNMGYTSHTLTKTSKFSIPLSFEYFFTNSEISINLLPSYDVSKTEELISNKTLANSKRLRLNESLQYGLHFEHLDIITSVINSNRSDGFTGTYRVYETEESDESYKESELDYSISSLYTLGRNKVELEVATATRFPSLYELFGDNLYVIPNPNLKSESSTFKGSLKYGLSISDLLIQAQYQLNLIDNLITSNMYDERSMQFFNTDKSKITTISLSAAYNYRKLFGATFNIAYNDAINISEGNKNGYKIPNIHPFTSKLLLNSSYSNFGLNINGYYYSMVYTNSINKRYDKPEPDYLSDDGSYGYIPEHLKIDIGLSHLNNYFKTIFGIENIMDNRVSLSPYYVNQGRLFSLTLLKNF